MKKYLLYCNRDGKPFESTEYASKSLRFWYHTFIGRLFLWVMTRKWISDFTGRHMNSKSSKKRIKKFIQKHNIDMTLYEDVEYKCYNDFFTRKLKEIKIDMEETHLISPCDSKLSYYKITDDLRFNVKNSIYSINTLLCNENIAKEYKNGICLVFRLTVSDYHRYVYIDDGTKEKNIHIKGIYHTVQPIAVEAKKVYHQNTREYTVLHTKNFGDVIHMEVGAMCVGKIDNYHHEHKFKRGEEKGKFLFGGSTIILLLKENTVTIDEDIINAMNMNAEMVVKIGTKIGKKVI